MTAFGGRRERELKAAPARRPRRQKHQKGRALFAQLLSTVAIRKCFLHGDSRLSPLHVTDQPPLRPGVAVDVAFGRFDGAMASEQLHVAQTAARAMNVAGGEDDEAATTRMRRAALEAELFEPGDEPVDHAVRGQVPAAIRADDRSDGFAGSRLWSACDGEEQPRWPAFSFNHSHQCVDENGFVLAEDQCRGARIERRGRRAGTTLLHLALVDLVRP
jgi:hypothetical protein